MSSIPQVIRRAFGDDKINRVLPRSGGQLSTVYEVHRSGHEPVIVKIYAEQWQWKQAKEIYVYRLLADRGLSAIPKILDSRPDGCTVMTQLPGKPLREVAAELSVRQLRDLYHQVGELLAQIHGVGMDQYGYISTDHIVDPLPTNSAYMIRQFTKKLDEFTDLGGNAALAGSVKTYVDRRLGLFADNTKPVLCHNDFHDANVLVTGDHNGWSVSGFIDVENAVAADPLLDLAKTDYYTIRGDTNKMASLLQGYGPLPSAWADRLAIYRLYHAVELWDWFASTDNLEPLRGIADDIETAITSKPYNQASP